MYTENSTLKNKPLSSWVLRTFFAVMTIGIVFAFVYFKGNPLIGMKLDKETDRYLQENYPEVWQEIERTTDAYFIKNFNFLPDSVMNYKNNDYKSLYTDGGWWIYYSNKETPYMRFTMVYNRDGNLVYDGCKDRYLTGGAIYTHFSDIYRNYIVDIYDEVYNNGLPKSGITLSAVLGDDSAEAWFIDSPNKMDCEDYIGPVLDIAQEYTMEELAEQYGEIVFTYRNDEKTIDQLYKRRLEVAAVLKEYDVPYKKVRITFGVFEGVYDLTEELLYSDDLKPYIEENYMTTEDILNPTETEK